LYLLRQEKIIAALAKSIIWGAFPIDYSPILLEQFVSHGKYIEELIRAFLTKLRAKAGNDEWRYILETLKAVTKSFDEHLSHLSPFPYLTKNLISSFRSFKNPSSKSLPMKSIKYQPVQQKRYHLFFTFNLPHSVLFSCILQFTSFFY
jgi:hypothetical protein